MKKKLLSTVLCVAMTAAMVAGCGSKTDDSNSAAATESGATASDGTIALTVWGAEEDQSLLQEMVDSFEAANPDQKFDITIGVQSESTAKDTVLADVEAAADVYAFADDQLNELVQAGALQAVQDTDTISSENSEGSVEAATYDGTLYAYPMTADNGYFLFYDKSVFTEDDVKSMDSLLAAAAAADKKVSMDWTSGWYLYSFFAGAGLDVNLNDDGVTNSCNWNATDTDIKGVDVAEAMLNIAQNSAFISQADAEFVTGIQDGSVAAGINGTWNAKAAEEAWGENYAATKLPTYTVAGQEVQMGSFAGYKMLGVNAYSKNVGWAMELAKWITNEDNQTLRFEERGQGPANKNAAASDAVAASPAIKALIEQSDYANLQRVGGNYWDPVQTFGEIMANGNPDGEDLQTLLDNTVEGVTAPVAE